MEKSKQTTHLLKEIRLRANNQVGKGTEEGTFVFRIRKQDR